MQYTWEGRCAFEMAAIPKAAADGLKLSSAPQLRVLIWLCCVGNGAFDAAACAKACGCSPEETFDLLQYWVQQGLIKLESGVAATQPVALTVKEEASPAVSTAPAEQAAPPTPSERPSRSQVMEVCETDERFKFLLETAQVKLGKALSPADMAVYLYLYRDLKLPPEVILMIIGYAVKNGKAKLTYIEKTAIGWVEDGITTIAAADEYLCRLERREQAWGQMADCGIEIARPTVSQKDTAFRWIAEWAMPAEVIAAVAAYTTKTLGKFQMPYADRILERFHAEGIMTAEAANKDLTAAAQKTPKKRAGRMKTASDRDPSFDLGQYEEQALRHRPRPPRQEE